MEKEKYDHYTGLLKKELIPALGCTDPIAIAYGAAKAAEVLGEETEHLVAICSGNIIKNVKGVVVPNSGGNKGIKIAAILGAVAGDAGNGLKVLEKVQPEQAERCAALERKGFCECRLAEGVDNLHIDIIAEGRSHSAEVVISDTHTNISKIVKDGRILLSREVGKNEEDGFIYGATIGEILDFADTVSLADIEGPLKAQIKCNTAISEEGLAHRYGANVGKVFIENENADFDSRVKGKATAATDARMSGCDMPVVINSGSGNQGIAVCLPVVEYAKDNNIPEDRLLRALALSNLISIYAKKKIGSLSAFCGLTTAVCGAGAGIAYLKGFTPEGIGQVIEFILLNVGGLICDGAKSSCSAKLASALDAMLLSLRMVEKGYAFGRSEGLMGKDADETVRNVCYIGKNGMSGTDISVLKIMTGEITTD